MLKKIATFFKSGPDKRQTCGLPITSPELEPVDHANQHFSFCCLIQFIVVLDAVNSTSEQFKILFVPSRKFKNCILLCNHSMEVILQWSDKKIYYRFLYIYIGRHLRKHFVIFKVIRISPYLCVSLCKRLLKRHFQAVGILQRSRLLWRTLKHSTHHLLFCHKLMHGCAAHQFQY